MLDFWIPTKMSWRTIDILVEYRGARTVLKNSVSDKTKRCGIDRSHDSFNVYGCIWKDIGV
jgi:hypothetical protein